MIVTFSDVHRRRCGDVGPIKVKKSSDASGQLRRAPAPTRAMADAAGPSTPKPAAHEPKMRCHAPGCVSAPPRERAWRFSGRQGQATVPQRRRRLPQVLRHVTGSTRRGALTATRVARPPTEIGGSPWRRGRRRYPCRETVCRVRPSLARPLMGPWDSASSGVPDRFGTTDVPASTMTGTLADPRDP